MALFIIVGWLKAPKAGESIVKCLYAGESGADGQALAEQAANDGGYSRIGRTVNPMFAPLAIDPTPTKSSGPPKFPKRVVATLPKVGKAPAHIQEGEDALAKARKDRLAPTKPAPASEVGAKGGSSVTDKPSGDASKPVGGYRPSEGSAQPSEQS